MDEKYILSKYKIYGITSIFSYERAAGAILASFMNFIPEDVLQQHRL